MRGDVAGWLSLLAQTQAAIEAVEAAMRESLTPRCWRVLSSNSCMVARHGTAQLTPLTTGRDNRGTSRSLPEDTAAEGPTSCGSSAKARNISPMAAGLGVSARWLDSHIALGALFLCATSCLIVGDGLIGRIGAARLPRGYPRGNDQTIKTPGGSCDGKIRHREPTGAQAPAHRALGRGCVGGHCHIHPCRPGIRLVDGGVALSGSDAN